MVYRSPGVYTKEVALPNPIQSNAPLKIVSIAGIGSTTILVENVEIVRGATSTDTIPDTTTNDVSSVVMVGDLPGYSQYAVSTDYTITDNTIVWGGGVAPAQGNSYYLTFYKVKDASYYEPATFFDIKDVRNYYGNELNGGVISEITLAAALAFQNGAAQVVCVQQESASTADKKSAIDKLELVDLDYILAPGMTDSTMSNYIWASVVKMNSITMKKERQYITSGLELNDSVATLQARAESFNDELVTMIAPAKVEVVQTDGLCNIDQSLIVSGAYAGAALAGKMSDPNFDVAEPVTYKVIYGINSLAGVKYYDTEMNNLAASGSCVLFDNNGTIRVRHGLTTNTDGSAYKAEIQIVNIKQATKKELRLVLKPFIGTKYVTPLTNSLIAATIDSFCKQKVSAQIFDGYRNISVTQSTQDPRIALVSFEFKPVSTTTWIDVNFGMYIS